MKPISATTTMMINIVLAIVTGFSTGAVKFTGLLPDSVAMAVVGWSGVAAFIISCVNVGLAGYSSSGRGPLAPPGS